MPDKNPRELNFTENPSTLPIPNEVLDITDKFVLACRSALSPGELCHPPWFNLHYSISAIEIMDPKMDIRVTGSRRVLSTSEALTKGLLPLGPFAPEELLGIMDELLCALVNYFTGDSLNQTVFCCMYMHCTQLLKDDRLAIFCELLRLSIRNLRNLIVNVKVFDEEDFVPLTHGMPLNAPDPHFNCFCSTMNSLPDVVQSSSELLLKAQTLTDSLPVFSENTDPDKQKCIRIRLEFVMNLFRFSEKIVSMLNDIRESDLLETEIKGFDSTESKTPSLPLVSVGSIPEFLNRIVSFCSTCMPELRLLQHLSTLLSATSSVGLTPGPGRTSPKDFPYGIPGFELFLNQSSLPSYMPRFVVINTRSASFSYLEDLFGCLLKFTSTITSLLSLADHQAFSLHWFWLLLKNSVHCSMCNQSACNDSRCSKPNNAVLFRTVISLLCSYSMGRLLLDSSIVPIQADLIIESWMSSDTTAPQAVVRSTLLEITGLKSFFSLLSQHLFEVLRSYFLNRSRQRTVLAQSLQRMTDLMDECLRCQWILGKEIYKRLNPMEDVDIASMGSCELHLVDYLRYYYYILVRDYVISGFQLELYSPHEWVFMYTFLLQLLQQWFNLIERFINLPDATQSKHLQSLKNGIVSGDSPASDYQKKTGQNRRSNNQSKKNRSKKHRDDAATENSSSGLSSNLNCTIFQKFCGPRSELELSAITVHRLLTAATLYVLRAIQLDSGGDPVLDSENECIGFGNPLEMYSRRLGLFLTNSIPLSSDLNGVSGAFYSSKRYVTTGVFSGPTTELYTHATHTFESARHHIQILKNQYEREINQPSVPLDRSVLDLMQQVFSAPDSLTDLERLATRNAIACRILATCPDRRPPKTQTIPLKCPFLSSTSPVHVDFDHLPSRSYPLIRLVSSTIEK